MNVNANRPRLLNVVNSSLMVGKLPGQLQYLHERGFDVVVISPGGEGLDRMARLDGVRAIEMLMARRISVVRDVASLWRLVRVIGVLRPTITNVGTPKAGLLAGLAAWMNGVPCRVYTLRGLRFETTKGVKRRLLIYAERLACCFAHRVICVSHSVREKAIDTGLTTREKTVVFGSGSSNGVDVQRFAPTPHAMRQAAALRRDLGIPDGAPVLGYVGRLTRDKGIPELVEAFVRLRKEFPDLRLLLVGRFEDEDPLPPETRRLLETNVNVILPGHPRTRQRARQPAGRRREDWPVEDAVPYYALMDLFVLASHREGLPNVVLEAQAAGKPVVAARATGIVDAVIEGKTGLLFPIGDVAALTAAVAKLLRDNDLADGLARAGQKRVQCEFRQEQIWEALHQEYLALLGRRNAPPLRHAWPAWRGVKRALDLAASSVAIVLLSPLLLLVAAAVWTWMGRGRRGRAIRRNLSRSSNSGR
jgi:glycosyltransferase involved in cell wall biosynthesis